MIRMLVPNKKKQTKKKQLSNLFFLGDSDVTTNLRLRYHHFLKTNFQPSSKWSLNKALTMISKFRCRKI